MRVLARITPGSAWVPGTVYSQGTPVRDHLRHMRRGFADGTLLLGGPLLDGMSGMALLEVPDVAAAQAFADADPGVQAGVLTYHLDQVVPYFDALAPQPDGAS